MTFVSNEPLLGTGLVVKKLGDSAEKLAVAIAKCINMPAKQINLTICML